MAANGKGSEMDNTMATQDADCNALFRKLDELKARGEGGRIASAEYMETLRALKVATTARMQSIAVMAI